MNPIRDARAVRPTRARRVSMIACGLMSGTSADGIDAAVIRVRVEPQGPRGIELLSGLTLPFPDKVRREIFALFEDGPGSLERLALLNARLGGLFAEAALAAIKAADVSPENVEVIGSHGQTLRHVSAPKECGGQKLRATLQIGDGAIIAERTGVPTVTDFRTADIAAGGTGAPLVPFFDIAISRGMEKPIAFQNLGGIGNVTYSGKDGDVIAFDTGPGNMIVDRLAAEATRGRLRFDRDGKIGRAGRIREDLLERWMRHGFLRAPPPKTAGREEFGSRFFEREILSLAGPRNWRDLVRTAERFTALSISRAYLDHLPRLPRLVVVTGGGAYNPLIMADLRELLPECRVVGGEELGISVDYKEAEAFALMGLCTLLGIPSTVPAATGARHAVIAGKVSFPSSAPRAVAAPSADRRRK